jgi:hypothetical protein
MRFAKLTLVAVIAVLLAAYAFDCDSLTTPEQAMECCNSMPCSTQGHHGQDCCKTMPSMYSPFVQASTVHAVFSVDVVAVLPASIDSLDPVSSARIVASHWHAPPGLLLPSRLPLRI